MSGESTRTANNLAPNSRLASKATSLLRFFHSLLTIHHSRFSLANLGHPQVGELIGPLVAGIAVVPPHPVVLAPQYPVILRIVLLLVSAT